MKTGNKCCRDRRANG